MNSKKISYAVIGALCITLAVFIRTAALPFALVYTTLDAASDWCHEAANKLHEKMQAPK